jgi:hypothetical protein
VVFSFRVGRKEGPDVELVDDEIMEAGRPETLIMPGVAARVACPEVGLHT